VEPQSAGALLARTTVAEIRYVLGGGKVVKGNGVPSRTSFPQTTSVPH